MISKNFFNYLLITLLLITIFPLFSYSQAIPGENFLQITAYPENPEPFQSIHINLQSYLYDLDRSNIIWSVNGVVKKNETGLKDFDIIAGKSGQKTTVTASVQTPEDGIQNISTSFTPSVVDLIYEPFSYTPPFYKGKALNPNQGKVLVTAIPELITTTGEKIPTKNIIFSWRKDGIVQQTASGIGKNTLIFEGTIPIRDTSIQVKVSSLDGNLSAIKQVNITNVSPKIIFYENNPVYGIMFNNAIKGNVTMLGNEFSIMSVPYYFSADTGASPSLDYTWSMNGRTVTTQTPKNSFATRIDTPRTGTANIGLKISNNIRIFQFIDDSFNISFSER